MNSLIDAYNKLNNSFKQTLIFHVGESGGFFSEYNCMILAMLYCLQNKIRFVLYSKDANFGYKNGWIDYFEPFCGSTASSIHSYLNVRVFYDKVKVKDPKTALLKIRDILFKLCARISKPVVSFTYYTQDLWDNFFDPKMVSMKYDIPELSIKGDITHACNRLVELTWNYNDQTKKKINAIIEELNLPDVYISCQIRAGDKNKECSLLPVEDYINKIEEYENYKDIFVLTDDYRIIEQLQKDYSQWNWRTSCKPSERGYFHSSFRKANKLVKREKMLNFFASIEILNKSDIFIGTRTANPCVFMSMYNPQITKIIDFNDNKIIKEYFSMA